MTSRNVRGVTWRLASFLVLGSLLSLTTGPISAQELPSIQVTKGADGAGTLSPGQAVAFEIAVANTGSTTAVNLLVVDDYEERGFAAIDLDPGNLTPGADDGDVITWEVKSLAPGAVWTASYTATARSELPVVVQATGVTNRVTVLSGGVKVAEDSVVLDIPTVSITKVSDSDRTVNPGQTVTFTLNVVNEGAETVRNVVVTDDYDQDAAISLQLGDDEVSASGVDDGDAITWDVGDLDPGEEWRAQYSAALLGTTNASNQATVSIDGVDVDTASVTLTPTISIDKVVLGVGAIQPGDTAEFVVTVVNSGSQPVQRITVEDEFDESTFSTIQLAATNETEGSVESGLIRWEIAELGPGEDWTAVYFATASTAPVDPTGVVNTATVKVDGTKVASDRIHLRPPFVVQRSREILDGGAEAGPGTTVRLIISVHNTLPAAATNVVVEDVLTFEGLAPDETMPARLSNFTPEAELTANRVRWVLGTVEAGTTSELSYELTIDQDLNRGTVSLDAAGTLQAEGIASVAAPPMSLTIRSPRISITRAFDDTNGGDIEPGDTLRFAITVRNRGSTVAGTPAAPLILRDAFNELLFTKIDEISAEGAPQDGSVEWVFTEPLGPGLDRTVSYSLRLSKEFGESVEVTNTATALIGEVTVAEQPETFSVQAAPPVPEAPRGDEDFWVLFWAFATMLGVTAGGFLMLKVLNTRITAATVVTISSLVIIVDALVVLVIVDSPLTEAGLGVLGTVAGFVLGRGEIAKEG